jgi:NTE family protein
MVRKKIGLALSGGGARGFSHVGVLNVLAQTDIHFDMIAGTSAGAVVGAALAAGMSTEAIGAMAGRAGYAKMMRPSLSPRGLFSNAPLGSFIASEFPVTRFEDLTIPFGAVAYDLDAGEEILMKDTGDLAFAVRASCAVPGVFVPLIGPNGHLFVDGGVSSPLPVDAVRAMGADVVVAVDLIGCGGNYTSPPRTGMGLAIRAALELIKSASRNQACRADVIIQPQIAHLRPDQLGKRDEFIMLGEVAANLSIVEIRKLL